ncbi:hypothetical protein ACNR9Q_13485 [Maribacter sp. X9]|uniref:hypothetical protein n=1 Tax=Maribacter sp. X9 TaxID=3402159 RepID=UPI003AF40467
MKQSIIVAITFLLSSCSNKKEIKYVFENTEIELNWFYVKNTDTDMIEVKCGDTFQTIFETQKGIEEVQVVNKKIIISHPQLDALDPKIQQTKEICGYTVEHQEFKPHEVNHDAKTIKTDSLPTQEVTEFKNQRWISTTDSLSGIEIKKGKWILFYKGMETKPSDFYTPEIRKAKINETSRKPIEYMTLTNSSDTLEYVVLEHTADFLSLSYIPRGNTLDYRPEK